MSKPIPDPTLPTKSVLCVEIPFNGRIYLCINGTWYRRGLFNNDMTEVHDEWIHVDLSASYEEFLEENSQFLESG